jgi:tetratricopeptide (TPR) repeat protein
MLPPALMLAIKKRGMGCLLVALLIFNGCAPPGPRALLKGQRLIDQGKYDQAVQSLQEATRLLPKNAQAFNHLGLALHGKKQFAPALAAYLKALSLDHKLAAAHYNLGCLYLEQNDPSAATDQLTSYTLLQPNSADGWTKLGTAQLRAHKIDAAEKSFKTGLALNARQPEALNGLGVIQVQRKRPQDALNYFNSALSQKPTYSPALLNAGLVSQQYLNNRPSALEKYRQYLALQPRAAYWETVSAIAGRLDTELNPPPPPVVRVAQSSPAPSTPSAAPPPPPVVKTNLVAQANPAPRPASNRPPAVATVPRTNPPPVTPSPKIVAQTNQPATNPFVIATAKPLPEPPKPLPAVTSKPEVEVTQIPEELVVKPPEEIVVVRPPITPAPTVSLANPTNPSPVLVSKPEAKPDKRTLLSRLNPFGGKSSSGKEKSTLDEVETSSPSVPAGGTNIVVLPVPATPPIPRYTYVSPSKPAPGNRKEAERFFSEGIKAQQSGRAAQALAAYQKATRLDPAYFEAYYNQGLAAYGLGNWKESLLDYEYALALKPNSVDTRYNFALALQQANYAQDAADELLEILNESPAETRAHLLLANLYARQLNQPKLARQHYLRVLEDDPRHPKAAEIRYWLAANP